MGSLNWNSTSLFSLHLLLFFSFFFGCLSVDLPNPFLTEIVCKIVNCGEGTCKAANDTFLGVDCECNPGWKKIEVGPFVIPSCIIPNCTVNFGCGSQTPPPPPPPPPSSLFPSINLVDPCSITWCGEGTCEMKETLPICKCNEGAANLFNLPDLACFKQCFFGADCQGFGLGPPAVPPPPQNSASPKTGTPGSSKAPDWSRKQLALTILLLAAIFLSLV